MSEFIVSPSRLSQDRPLSSRSSRSGRSSRNEGSVSSTEMYGMFAKFKTNYETKLQGLEDLEKSGSNVDKVNFCFKTSSNRPLSYAVC